MNNKTVSFIILLTAILLFVFIVNMFIVQETENKTINKKKSVKKYYKIYTEYYKGVYIEFENIEFYGTFAETNRIKTITIDDKKRGKKFELLKNEMDKFSETLLKKHLIQIYFASDLFIRGKKFGGTYLVIDKSIYFSTLPSFHAELSSLFYKQNFSKFPEKEWLSLNEDKYTNNSFELLDKEGVLDKEEEFLLNGFLNEYGQTNMEMIIMKYSN